MSRPNLSRRLAAWGTVAVAAAGVAVAAWAAPSGGPTTAPSTSRPAADGDRYHGGSHHDRHASADDAGAVAPAVVDITPKPMSPAFSVVEYRSIFVRGNQTIGHATETSHGTRTYPPPVPPRPEASLVFRGVVFTGTDAEAMIEDVANRKAFTVAEGGPVATGRLTGITFDALDYLSHGKTTHVALGQTLDGTSAPAGDDAAPTSAPSPTGGGGSNSGTGGTSTLGDLRNVSPQDILERMRKRREAELNKK